MPLPARLLQVEPGRTSPLQRDQQELGGKPLRSFGMMVGYIRGTTTTTGLEVTAYLDEDTYKKGQKATRDELSGLNTEAHQTCPNLNYTIKPRTLNPKSRRT